MEPNAAARSLMLERIVQRIRDASFCFRYVGRWTLTNSSEPPPTGSGPSLPDRPLVKPTSVTLHPSPAPSRAPRTPYCPTAPNSGGASRRYKPVSSLLYLHTATRTLGGTAWACYRTSGETHITRLDSSLA